jgi:peptidoglycan/xylan/chitin deacetylase (PgdA/CDA1 family)
MRKLVITVDAELSNFPDGIGLWGRVAGEEWGLARLVRELGAAGVAATFFLDAYGGDDATMAEQRRAAELIARSGHDLQLHTHPAPAFERRRDQLKQYSPAEQERVIALGVERLSAWAGVRPVLHRAGDWAADHASLQVLKRLGFRGDFSASPWSRSCAIDRALILGNGWRRIEGLLCGVGTCYRDRLTGRLRRVDLGGVSFRETLEILSRGIDPFLLTLHSFSLLRYDASRTRFAADPGYLAGLLRLVDAARRDGYETATALEAVDAVERLPALPWQPLPTTGAFASAVGILKSVRGRFAALSH